jgi:hypothetical protein
MPPDVYYQSVPPAGSKNPNVKKESTIIIVLLPFP